MTPSLSRNTEDTLMAPAGETKAQREATPAGTILRKPLPLERHRPNASHTHTPPPDMNRHGGRRTCLVRVTISDNRKKPLTTSHHASHSNDMSTGITA